MGLSIPKGVDPRYYTGTPSVLSLVRGSAARFGSTFSPFTFRPSLFSFSSCTFRPARDRERERERARRLSHKDRARHSSSARRSDFSERERERERDPARECILDSIYDTKIRKSVVRMSREKSRTRGGAREREKERERERQQAKEDLENSPWLARLDLLDSRATKGLIDAEGESLWLPRHGPANELHRDTQGPPPLSLIHSVQSGVPSGVSDDTAKASTDTLAQTHTEGEGAKEETVEGEGEGEGEGTKEETAAPTLYLHPMPKPVFKQGKAASAPRRGTVTRHSPPEGASPAALHCVSPLAVSAQAPPPKSPGFFARARKARSQVAMTVNPLTAPGGKRPQEPAAEFYTPTSDLPQTQNMDEEEQAKRDKAEQDKERERERIREKLAEREGRGDPMRGSVSLRAGLRYALSVPWSVDRSVDRDTVKGHTRRASRAYDLYLSGQTNPEAQGDTDRGHRYTECTDGESDTDTYTGVSRADSYDSRGRDYRDSIESRYSSPRHSRSCGIGAFERLPLNLTVGLTGEERARSPSPETPRESLSPRASRSRYMDTHSDIEGIDSEGGLVGTDREGEGESGSEEEEEIMLPKAFLSCGPFPSDSTLQTKAPGSIHQSRYRQRALGAGRHFLGIESHSSSSSHDYERERERVREREREREWARENSGGRAYY
ncbi:hypothetical protein KIPB_006616 [Kipferlia bialata]|uniref:Uncharacterized protein n=1 Tax=Kipferlia bialata TaxID=797122 RepID=A0A9K3CZ42_9EUKA|nr:hypothetical protein KIPB_006616 [Kipferlia bialata]|eukprot:g6616.t1